MDKRLTETDYKQLLQNRFQDPEIKFVKADFKHISENMEGFMGAHFKLKITYSKNKTEFHDNLFVKTKPFDVTADHPANADNIYDKEIFFYDVLSKKFETLGYETSFSPKSYLCVNTETLIMEDMCEKGFKIPERQTYYDISKVKCLLKSLALLHAASFSYEKTKSQEMGKTFSVVEENPLALTETFFTQYTTGKGFGVQWFKSIVLNFKTIIDTLEKDDEYKENFKKYLEQAEFGKIFVEDHGLKKCYTHGDLWSNNMMFKCLGQTAEECCLVDYQIARHFYPAFDVLLATYFNTDEDFCKSHLQEMYQYYYDTFSAAVKKYGYSPEEFMPFGDFEKGLEICRMDALIQVASVNSMIFVPANFLEEHVKGKTLGNESHGDIKMEDQMKEMQKNFIPLAFENDKIYRKAMTKHLYDLYDALERKYGRK